MVQVTLGDMADHAKPAEQIKDTTWNAESRSKLNAFTLNFPLYEGGGVFPSN